MCGDVAAYISGSLLVCTLHSGPYLHVGPGPRAANFQGWHIKKIEIEVWHAEKKGCPRERNLREIYTVCLLVPKQEEDHFPSGIAGIVELINCTWKLN